MSNVIIFAVMILQLSPVAAKPKISIAKDSMFRFDYSIYFLRWALKPPEYLRRTDCVQSMADVPPNSYRFLFGKGGVLNMALKQPFYDC